MSEKTITVKRANVILDISESQLDYYMSQGYDVIDETGKVIQASVPTDVGTLQKAYFDHINEIEAMKEEIEALKTEIESLKTPRKKTRTKNE